MFFRRNIGLKQCNTSYREGGVCVCVCILKEIYSWSGIWGVLNLKQVSTSQLHGLVFSLWSLGRHVFYFWASPEKTGLESRLTQIPSWLQNCLADPTPRCRQPFSCWKNEFPRWYSFSGESEWVAQLADNSQETSFCIHGIWAILH